jgi:hypothetical protein
MVVMSPKFQGPALPEGESLASFKSYTEAVAYVEKLIENEFPAKLVSIIGSDLKTVENLRGKLGYGRVSLSGALTGSWIGMFFGLLFGATGPLNEQMLLTNIGAGIVIGAGVGMLINILRFSLTKNKRSFISGQTVVAKKYEVIVPADQLALAKQAASKKASPKSEKSAS